MQVVGIVGRGRVGELEPIEIARLDRRVHGRQCLRLEPLEALAVLRPQHLERVLKLAHSLEVVLGQAPVAATGRVDEVPPAVTDLLHDRRGVG